MKKNTLLLILIFLGLAVNIYAQQKQISRGDFYQAVGEANDKRFNSSRREKMTLKVFSDGKLKSTTTEINEFLKPDKKRYVLIEKKDDTIKKLELINIGGDFYQKKDDGDWTTEEKWNLRDSFLSIPVPISSEYSVEVATFSDKPVKIYRHYSVYNEYKPKEGEEKQTYWEQKTWINNEGFEIREEIFIGKPKSKEVMSHRIFEYEYDPTIKIEAPFISKNKSGKTIENSELDEVKAKAENLLQGKSYRKEEITEVYSKDGSKLLRKVSKVYELLPPERFYYSEIEEKGGKTKKTEFVRIYDMRFERINGGKWRSYSQKNSDSFAMKVSKKQKSTQFLGTEKLGEKTAKVYEVFEKYTSSVKGDVESSKKYWFDENGYLLKSYMEENSSQDSSVTKILEKYDYDAKIKIEAPEQAGIDN